MVSFAITIDARPERVFDELSHVERHPGWSNPTAKMTMDQVAGDGPGPDARYHSAGIFVGKPVSADITVTRFEPGKAFTIRSDQHQEGKEDVWYTNAYTFTPEGSGTRLRKDVDTNGAKWLLYVAYPAVKRDAMTALRNLKAKLESTS